MTPPILVLAPYSSGSTAITGYLARAGAYPCPPFQMTNDPKTPNSHEPKAFRDAVCEVVEETTLNYIGDSKRFGAFFREWLPAEEAKARKAGHNCVVLKHPLAAFVLGEILAVCRPRIVVVGRPLSEIERTRERRGWHLVYGQAGALKIYNQIFAHTLNTGLSALLVDYRQFLDRPFLRRDLLAFCRLSPDQVALENAESWLRR